ncbi:YhcB family protein [Celerinatantimonas sp. MCCC 1A17872]|uniref:YhcB family protein n=1 Tax=Celerinatantimonas sp. MCCC 1A17872 TaxID=3177514 RepID=UPI0038CBD04D
MDIMTSLILVAAGVIIGILISQIFTHSYRHESSLKKELEQSRAELKAYRQQVNNHFQDSAQLLDELAQQYQKIYQHMAEQSTQLLDDPLLHYPMFDPDKKTLHTPAQSKLDAEVEPPEELSDTPPKDYTNERSGILKNDPT